MPCSGPARRVVLLFLLGLIYNGLLQFHFDTLRVTGVLQRIAICYGIAALIFLFTKVRTQAILFVAILVGYWAILMYVPSPESKAAGDLAKETNLAGYLDRHYLPGKIYKMLLRLRRQRGAALDDPGGRHGAPGRAGRPLAALGSQSLDQGARPGGRRAGPAWAWALLWGRNFPIIKNLWTSSFVLVAGGWSLLLLALFYTIIDVMKLRAWAFFFVVIGVNAITIYIAKDIIPFDEISKYFLGGVARYSGSFGPVVVPIGVIVIEWLFLLHLYRNRIFLRV